MGLNQSVCRLGTVGEMISHDDSVKWDAVNSAGSPSLAIDDEASWFIPMALLTIGVVSALFALLLCELKRMRDMGRRSKSIKQRVRDFHRWRGMGDVGLMGLENDIPYGAYRTQ